MTTEELAAELKRQIEWAKSNCRNAMYVPVPTKVAEEILSLIEKP